MTKNEKLMIIIVTLFTFANSMAEVFMNVFLYTYTGSLIVMSIYTIIRIGIFPFLEYVAGKITVKRSYAFTLMLGLILMMCKLGFALGFNDYFAAHNWLVYIVAAIDGIAGGVYFLSANTLSQVITSKESRIRYLSIQGIFSNISNILSPLFSAFIIDMSVNDIQGYLNIFKCVLVIFTIMVIFAFKMKVDRGSDFTMKNKLWDKTDKKWSFCQFYTFLYGFRDSIILTLAGILVFNATGGSGSLYGKLLALFAVVTIVFFRIVSKKLNSHNFLKFYKFGAFLIASSTIVLVLVPNMFGAIYYGIVNAIATPMYGTCYSMITMNITQDYTKSENIVGRMIAKEGALSLGRCLGMILIIIFFMILPENLYLVVSVVLLSLFPIITYFFVCNYCNKGNTIL